MTAIETRRYDVCDPLPTGVTLLEASAGTGKTFTIAALAARYVAAGIPLERLLIVTFTRMATGELRERVRDRLSSAADGLARAIAGVPVDPDDDVLRLMADGPRDEVARRQDRLAKAVANFDAATIETTHGFCLRVLTELGVAGDPQRDITLVEDVRDLLEEVIDDLYVRRFWAAREPAPFDRAEAIRIGHAVLDHPYAEIVPERSEMSIVTPPAMRRRLIDAVRDEIERRKRAANLLTYDDVLVRLERTLSDPVRGPSACQRLRAHYDVALVDEFQDTDPIQWNIMHRAFGEGGSTLVLIGDPKQAIYAFRGADVYAYLLARETAASVATLATNWRSDQGLIDAYDALFAGAQLGHEGIKYRQVSAAASNTEGRLIGAPAPTPLRVRIVDRAAVPRTPRGYVSLAPARELIARDLAADVVELLSSPGQVVWRRRDGAEAKREPVRPGHLAVLVRTNRQAAIVRDALHHAGIPAVIGGAGSVFATDPAGEWLRLLDALEQPTARDRAAAVALTAFIGWTADQIATAADDTWEDLHWRLHRWAAVLRRRGIAALVEHITDSQSLPARILRRPAGERFLTDLHHIGQLLHAATTEEGLGAAALTAWLRRRIAEAGDDDADDEDRSRRLESDAEAVQVLTIHRSKGLEFPVVYCPYLWDGYSPDPKVPVFHDPDRGDVRTIDVAGEGPAWSRHCHQHKVEVRGEDLRLLYVALTRARHQAVVWWAATFESEQSPLGRLLFARDSSGAVEPFARVTPTDQKVVDTLAGLVHRSRGSVSVEVVAGERHSVWEGGEGGPGDMAVAAFERTLDEQWRRTSYTGITSRSDEPTVATEPEEVVVADEQPATVTAVPEALDDPSLDHLRDVPLLLAAMPGGVDVGTLIHRVLERTDFTSPDLSAELRRVLNASVAGDGVELGDLDAVVAGLQATIEQPLGPLLDDARLCDIGRRDRLDELGFELPLVGGDAPEGDLAVSDIAGVLRRHLPAGDQVASYATRLADASFDTTLRGFLSGSLDLVVRAPGPAGGRFAVVDYKTNWLGGGAGAGDDSLTAWHYRPAAVWNEMTHAHYPLQALLYTVAIHRYLRWRLPGYDPAVNLAGVLYLFIRGMSSTECPRVDGQACGVWSWRPPVAVVEGLSDLFDRGHGRGRSAA
jgi:exodeoxyribonuclease V beta subunit